MVSNIKFCILIGQLKCKIITLHFDIFRLTNQNADMLSIEVHQKGSTYMWKPNRCTTLQFINWSRSLYYTVYECILSGVGNSTYSIWISHFPRCIMPCWLWREWSRQGFEFAFFTQCRVMKTLQNVKISHEIQTRRKSKRYQDHHRIFEENPI